MRGIAVLTPTATCVTAAWSVCPSVCLCSSDTLVDCAKAVGWNAMSSSRDTRVVPGRNCTIQASWSLQGNWRFGVRTPAVKICIV